MPDRLRTMRSRSLERRFRRDGFVVAPAATPGEVAEARRVFDRFDSGIREGYYASIHSADPSYKVNVDRALTEVLWPCLDALLCDHFSLVAAFMVKPPTGSTVVPLHQDWCTMDETLGSGITCWLPLTNITDVEGQMKVLPGSHRYIEGVRGSPGFPAPYQDISQQICDELMVTLDVKVGDVLIMDGRVLHTTPENRSGSTRIAAYINALPVEARPLHYYLTPEGDAEGYWVDREFFTSFNIGERPPGEPFTTLENYKLDPLTMADLLARASAVRPRLPFTSRVKTHA